MEPYLSLLRDVLETGVRKADRTGVGTISVFGAMRKFDLRAGFPLVTTKRVNFENVVRELLWFLHGATNIHDDNFTDHTTIWDPWAKPDGSVGPIYGYQWRKWEAFDHDEASGQYQKRHIDQLRESIEAIKRNPTSRRIIVSAWNVADLPKMALPPCHVLYHLNVIGDRLDLLLYQRSCDLAIGVPYNIASYATLLTMVAQECGLRPGIFTHMYGDTHIYLNHLDGVRDQLTRTPYPLPTLTIARKPFDALSIEDFSLENYRHHPFIKFPIAV